MPPAPSLDMALLGVVELDERTFLLTVREQWMEKRWLQDVVHEREHTYTLVVGAGALDGDKFLPTGDQRTLRLYELILAWQTEKKLDRFIALDAPLRHDAGSRRYVLPPVPVLPRR